MSAQDLDTPVPKAPTVRVEKLLEPATCEKCSWAIDPSEVAIFFGEHVFCSARCYRAARLAPIDGDVGGEGGLA